MFLVAKNEIIFPYKNNNKNPVIITFLFVLALYFYVQKEGSKKSPKEKLDITVDDQQEKPPVLSIPYISGLNEEIKHVCKEYNIMTAFKSEKTEITAFQSERQITNRHRVLL